MSVCKYKLLPLKDIFDILRSFEEEINHFIHYILGYSKKVQYVVCALDLVDAIIRVDKRRFYFSVFHDMNINDCKKAALFAYWIVKFRPIKIVDPQYINKVAYTARINEMFAVHYLLSALCAEEKIHLWDGSTGVYIDLEHPYIEKLWYSFRFRNFTIDSMIVLADTINTDTFLQNKPPQPPNGEALNPSPPQPPSGEALNPSPE